MSFSHTARYLEISSCWLWFSSSVMSELGVRGSLFWPFLYGFKVTSAVLIIIASLKNAPTSVPSYQEIRRLPKCPAGNFSKVYVTLRLGLGCLLTEQR